MLATRVDGWMQGWHLDGFREGKVEGQQEGGRLLLSRLLERRFGPLPEDVRHRLLAADAVSIEEWAIRALDAASLSDVLDTGELKLEEMRDLLANQVTNWEHEWRRRGFKEGREEGRQETQSHLLLRLLEYRFGPLPKDARARVAKARLAELPEWSLRVLEANDLSAVLDPALPADKLGLMEALTTLCEEHRHDWLIEGRRQGRVEGRREGQADMLLHQLERRFEFVSNKVRDRVRAASVSQLEGWADRVLDVGSVEDVLA